MKKTISIVSSFALVLSTFFIPVTSASADSSSINFEPTAYTVGNINGQQGWSATGSAGSGCAVYDEGVSDNSTIPTTPATFGTQSFRISNAVTSGCFSDQAFAPALTQPAGESGASNGTFGPATPLPHFESSFDIYAIPGSTGDILSVSPDQGTGARMTYLRFENPGDGLIHVYFDDVTDPSHTLNADTFNEFQIAQLSANTPHNIKFSIDFANGPDNDVVDIYIDGAHTFTGTSWEDYYRFDSESNPTNDVTFTPTVRTMLFRAGGTAVPANAGKGYLIDNLSMESGPSTPVSSAVCPEGTTQSANPVQTLSVNSNSSTPTVTGSGLTNGQQYLVVSSGTWQNSTLNVADTAYSSVNNWLTHMQGYNIDPYYLGSGEFQLLVDGNFANWGPYDGVNHTYSSLYTGTGSPAGFMVFDGDSNSGAGAFNPAWYGDNSGSLSVNVYSCDSNTPSTVQVQINKFLDGAQATTDTANNTSFPMSSTWTATNIGNGSGTYDLGPDDSYQATTAPMTTGATYTTNENIPSDCTAGNPYELAGYSTGSTEAQAIANGSGANQPSATVPNFTNLQSNEFVVVWNTTCPATPMLKVHILKYLNGVEATAISASNYQFPMVSNWTAPNIGTGNGSYTLGTNFGGATELYGADTTAMSAPADYTTSEVTSDIDPTSKVVPIGGQCAIGDYQLVGYTMSTSAFDTNPTNIVPTMTGFTGLTSDAYVIVWNTICPTTGSITITKSAIGGNGTFHFTSNIPGESAFDITTTNNTGSVTFNNVAPGTYSVTEVSLPKGWTQTDTECSSVAVTSGGAPVCTITNTNNKLLGEIRGTKYADRDGDGTLKDGDHHRLAGVTIYLDTNNNGVLDSGEPSTVTDSHGNYQFVGLTAGTYHVREVVQPGWTQTVPVGGVYNITLTTGQIAKKKDFGNFQLGSISGTKFNDLNGNGKQNNGESGIQGITINLKGPHNFTATTTTDANGNYSFTNLGPGTYTLSEVIPSGWHQTAHPDPVVIKSGTNSTKDNFGNQQITITNGKNQGKDNDNDGDNDNGNGNGNGNGNNNHGH